MTMHAKNRFGSAQANPSGGRLAAAVSAFLATLLAWPVSAGITVPSDPLTTASRVPPNLLFILDNSGSMQYAYMPDSVPRVGTTSAGTGTVGCGSYINSTNVTYLACNTYTRNTLYYNPAIDYQPWTKPDGSLFTGGTSYDAVYSNIQNVPYTGTGPTGSGTVTTTSTTEDLSSQIQTFYVPKNVASTDSTGYLATGANYYRYQILTDGRVQRSEYAAVMQSNVQSLVIDGGSNVASGTLSNNSTVTLTLSNVPSGVALQVTLNNTTTGTQTRTLNYAVRDPSGTQVGSGSVTRGNNTTYTLTPTSSGEYTVLLTRNNNGDTSYSVTASRFDTNSCDTAVATGSGWVNCQYATPSGRSEADERTNFATWYSYHRTRMKAAKAGASAAFAELGSDLRVGFRTISGANGSTTSGNIPTNAKPIAVQYNNGLFSDTGTSTNANAYNNRTQWYNRLFHATGSGSTPLRGAMRDAGTYFSSSANTGPYGPESGSDQLACRQNFTILTTDGYWNETYSDSTSIGNADNAAGTTISSPTNVSYQYTPGDPYRGGLASDSSPTLADVAMYYWKTDLRTDLSNIVPTSSNNPAFWQHMATFTIGLGLSGTVHQKSVAEVLANGGASYTSGGVTVSGWPTPANNTVTTIDDLLHAAVNGRGTYVAAGNPTEFTTGLKAALAAVVERTGSFSNVSATSSRVTTSTQIFHASYVSNVWTGELLACPINSNGTCDSTNFTWRASQGIPAYGTRKVFTHESGTGGAEFPTSNQLLALARTTAPSVTGEDNAAYIVGRRNGELANGGTLRNRNSVLGDIVTSAPTYSAEAGSVFVGANDGMLHAFDATTGAEQFAYIPGGVNVGSLATLSDTAYSHRYFVDGPIVVSTRKQTPAKNILVGALGRGGKGLFALDVTDPGAYSAANIAANVKWDKSGSAADANMGLVLGKPVIAKLNNGVMGLIVGNGINSTNEKAVLMIYNLQTGALIKQLNTTVGSATAPNGLAEPVGWNIDGNVDSNGNGTVDHVFAGDMQGNVWKFDLSSASVADWAVSNSGDPLYTATNADGAVQPITSGLTLAMNPRTFKVWLFFGTGRFITTGDTIDETIQSLYAFEVDGGSVDKEDDLQERSITYVTTSEGYTVRTFEANAVLPTDKRGWYMDLVAPPNPPGTAEGERVVSSVQINNTTLVVSSIIPTADACQSDGRGYVNAMDAFTGTSVSAAYFDLDGDGTAKNDVVTYTDSEGNEVTVPIGSVDLAVGMVTQANLLVGGSGAGGLACAAGSTGNMACVSVSDPRNVGRVSWREILRGG